MCTSGLLRKSLYSSEDGGRTVKMKFLSLGRTADNSPGAF